MTMASGYDSSSSSERDDEPSVGPADGWGSLVSSKTEPVPLGSELRPDEAKDSPRSSTPEQEPPALVIMTARAYQLEMLEESLKQNTIVAVCSVPNTTATWHADLGRADGHRERQDAGVSVVGMFDLELC